MKTIVMTLIAATLLTACSGPGHRAAFKQMQSDYAGPVYAVQGYILTGDRSQFEQSWNELIDVMKTQDGFVSSRISHGIGNSRLSIVHSEWRGIEDLRAVFADPMIVELESRLPVRARKFEHLFSLGSGGVATASE